MPTAMLLVFIVLLQEEITVFIITTVCGTASKSDSAFDLPKMFSNSLHSDGDLREQLKK